MDKVDESKLFQGKKGRYLDCVLIETPNSQYAQYMLVQSVSKEEREAGIKGAILGDGKVIGQQAAPPQNKVAEPGNTDFKGSDDEPF